MFEKPRIVVVEEECQSVGDDGRSQKEFHNELSLCRVLNVSSNCIDLIRVFSLILNN